MPTAITNALSRLGFGERAGNTPEPPMPIVETSHRNYGINPLTLHFQDRDLEDTYSTANFEKQIGITRLSIAMGAVIFAAYALLDLYIVPDILYEAWAIRFAIGCPLLLLLVVFSYSRFLNHHTQGLLALSMLVPGLAVVAITAMTDAAGSYLYYAGLIIIVGYNNCLWRLGYLYAGIVSVITFTAYELVILDFNPLPSYLVINNTAFLSFAIAVSIFINYIQDYQLRMSFVDNDKLALERSRSERLLSRSEAANRAKNDFLAIMSHELRTPLNAIIGFSEIISNQMFGSITQTKYVDYANDIRSSGAHLLSIINDILDISKAEAGKLQLEEEPIDPVDSLNRAMRMFRQRASELGVDLSFEVSDQIPWIIADPRLFNQVAINLTSNALKFTPEGGNVWVKLGLDASGNLSLSVKDTGIGIKRSDIPRVFEPFVQVESAMSRTHHGTGLGLPLVRKIMSLHGGTVVLESEVGEGTGVVATFPKSRLVEANPFDRARWNQR